MKKLVVLLALLLSSCSFSKGASSSEESSLPPSSSEPQALELTYTGNPVEIVKYGSTFNLANVLVNGEVRNDIPLKYEITTRDPAATLNDDHSLTAINYVYEARGGNINEFVNVRVEAALPYRSNALGIKVLVALYEEDVPFGTLLKGNDYTFYTSTGVVENINYYTAPSGGDWYSDGIIREVDGENLINTTISKNYTIGLESDIVTSHLKNIIKRDEKGASTVKDVRNGDKVKFITMYKHNELFGGTFNYDSIITEVISHDESSCTVTSYDSSLVLDAASKKYGDTFTVTAPKAKVVHLKTIFGNQEYESRVESGDNYIYTYVIKSKINKIYSLDNVSSAPTLVASYHCKTTGGSELITNEQVTDYLFNGEHEGTIEGLEVINHDTVYAGSRGLNLGQASIGYNSHVTFIIPRSSHINYIVITYNILAIKKNINVHYKDPSLSSKETGKVSTEDTLTNFGIELVDSSTLIDPSIARTTDYTEISMWIYPSSEGYQTGICIRGISFYTYSNFNLI